MRPFPGEMQSVVSKSHPYRLTVEQQDWLREVFPVTENIAIVRAMGICYPTLYRLAKLYGLKKTDEGLHAIRQRQAENHKRQIRKARFCLMGGIRPDGCHNVRIQPFTKLQISRRNKAVKRYGYIVKEGHQTGDHHPERYIIYYDSKTRRSAAFEANSMKDGFTFKKL